MRLVLVLALFACGGAPQPAKPAPPPRPSARAAQPAPTSRRPAPVLPAPPTERAIAADKAAIEGVVTCSNDHTLDDKIEHETAGVDAAHATRVDASFACD